MKARGYIALLLLTLYLAAVGTPAYVSLTCKCKAPREALQHTGCTCCDHTGDLPAARADNDHVEALIPASRHLDRRCGSFLRRKTHGSGSRSQ